MQPIHPSSKPRVSTAFHGTATVIHWLPRTQMPRFVTHVRAGVVCSRQAECAPLVREYTFCFTAFQQRSAHVGLVTLDAEPRALRDRCAGYKRATAQAFRIAPPLFREHIMTRSILTSQRRLLASSTVLVACALLAACGSSATGSSMMMDAEMGPVYFGDVMSFGVEVAPQPTTMVASTITLEY